VYEEAYNTEFKVKTKSAVPDQTPPHWGGVWSGTAFFVINAYAAV